MRWVLVGVVDGASDGYYMAAAVADACPGGKYSV